MANSPDDIIELTDIIEHGSGAPRQEGAADGVDLSFERELEDLFAESPPDKSAKADSDLPGLDSLQLPDEAAKKEDDMDLDGLDALLAEADAGSSEGLELPELTDDFLQEPEEKAALSAPQAPAAPGSAGDAGLSGETAGELAGRLDALESSLAQMRESLTASFQAKLDEALAGLRDEISSTGAAAAQSPEPVDPVPLIEELRRSFEERIEALAADIPPASEPTPPVDEDALAARIKEQVLAELAEQPAAEGEGDSGEAAVPAIDAEALEATVLSQVEERLDALQAEISAATEAVAHVAASVEASSEGTDGAPSGQELSAALRDDVEALKAQVESIPAPVDPAPLLAELEARLESRIAGLEAQAAAAPDLDGLASKDDLAALRRDILEEIRKSVPAAAARIIREEIHALVQEMD
jgi:hypothetical protein